MGRPIQSKVFGDVALPGFQFIITAKIPGEAAGEGYIVEQQGTSKYRVNVNGTEGVVFLVNTLTPANLNDGEAFVAVTPFGGSTVAASKIMQRKVNVFNIVDSPFSTYSSYKWSDLPADTAGQADVGVSVAAGAGNLVDASVGFIFNQTVDAAPYKTKFRTFGLGGNWNGFPSTPGNFKHWLHTTSDNKLIFHHHSNDPGFTGAVTIADGTTDPAPTIIDGAQITGSTLASQGGTPSLFYTRECQLTDTKFVRLQDNGTDGDELQIVNVNLTTGASSVTATYDATTLYEPIALINEGFGVVGGSGYTDGTQILTVDGGTFTRAATVEAVVSGGAVTAINRIVDGGAYTVAPVTSSLTGAGGTGASLTGPSYLTNKTTDNSEKFTFRISDTLFAYVYLNNGITNNSKLDGSIQITVLEDLGASIGVKMAKTTIYDASAPANNKGDERTYMRECGVVYNDPTNRIFTVFFQSVKPDFTNQSAFAIATKFNAGFTAIETQGTAVEIIDHATNRGFNNDEIAARRIDDNHILLSYEDRFGTDSPRLIRIVEVDSGTLVPTAGTAITAGPADGDWRYTFGSGNLLTLSSTRALLFMPFEWGAQEQAAGSVTVNQEPFDNTQDLQNNDRFVDTAANLTTAWSSATTGTVVCAIDTGFTHRYNGATWDLQTTNAVRRDYIGLFVQEYILNTTTNTVTLGKSEALINEQFPRWKLKDGATAPYDVSEIEPTGRFSTSGTEYGQAVLLPNGKIVVTGYSDQRIDENAPFLNETDFGIQANLDDGMGYWVQYFDPDAMP